MSAQQEQLSTMTFAIHVMYSTVRHAMLQIPALNVMHHSTLVELLVFVFLAILFMIQLVSNVM